MHLYPLLAGVVLLLFGRKLFWLFLGLAGFLFGMEISPLFFGVMPQWLQLLLAFGTGCLGALLAILAQRLAFVFAGFSVGVYLALLFTRSLDIFYGDTMLFIALGAGIIGAVCAALITDSAITVLSALIGAAAIVGELRTGVAASAVLFVVLAGTGIVFQEKLLAKPERKRKT